jgi:hypothetical protein
MSNEFLYKEYELNYEQLRFYDSRQSSIFQYLFTLTASVATAQFALYKFLTAPTPEFYKCHLFLSCIVFIATILLFLSMLQNRLYFVFTARQLNAIREYLLKTDSPEFKNNQLYTSTKFPALKPLSVHTFQLVGAVLISSMFAGSAMYALFPILNKPPSWKWSILIFILIAIIEFLYGFIYLYTQDRKTADEAIHLK